MVPMNATKVSIDNTRSVTYCTSMTYPALHKARAAAGGTYNDLARLLGVTASAISQWKCQERVSLKRALQIEALTGGQVTKEELRPDVFLDPVMSKLGIDGALECFPQPDAWLED